MKALKNSLFALVGLLATAGLLAIFTPTSGRGQGPNGPPARDVNVVNTPSVNVANPAASPALVRDVGLPLRAPIQLSVNVFMPFGQTFIERDIYTVPADKRLVIEHISLLTDSLSVGNAISGAVVTRSQNGSFTHPLDVQPQPPVGGQLFVVNHEMLAFADPGTTVQMSAMIHQAVGTDNGGFSVFRGTVSGHLENLP